MANAKVWGMLVVGLLAAGGFSGSAWSQSQSVTLNSAAPDALLINSSDAFSGESTFCDVSSPSSFALKGGFSGDVSAASKWKSVGVLRIKDGYLCPYLYTLIWGEIDRETARLVIFSGNYKYLGSYTLTGPQAISVKRNVLIIKTMSGKDESFFFKTEDLPPYINVDGENHELFK